MPTRALLLALLLAVLVPSHALAEAAEERVLIDATFRVIPPAEGAPCMQIEAGTLAVSVVAGDEGRMQPTTFHFSGYRGTDPGASVRLPVTRQGNAVSVPLVGGLYCWSLVVDAPVSADEGMAVRTNYAQRAALRMTLTQP